MKGLSIKPERWLVTAATFLAAAPLAAFLLVVEPRGGVGDGEFLVGEPAPRTLLSPLEITYDDETATEAVREKKRGEVLPVCLVDPKVREEITGRLDRFFEALLKIKSSAESKEKTPASLPIEIPQTSLEWLLEHRAPEDARKDLQFLLEQTLSEGVITMEEKKRVSESGAAQVRVVFPEGPSEKTVAVADLKTREEAFRQAENLLPPQASKDRNYKKALLDLFQVTFRPNLVWSEEETKARRKKAASEIAMIRDTIKRGELVVQRGSLVSAKEKQRLDQIEKQMAKRQILNQFSATLLFVLLIYILSFTYLFFLERRFLASLRMVALFHTVILLTLIVCKAIAVWPGATPHWMPTSLAALLLVLLVRPRIGVLGALAVGMLAGPLGQFRPETILASLASGLAAAFSAIRLRKRIQFLKVGAAVGAAQLFVVFSYRIFQDSPWQESFSTGLLGFVHGLLITVPLAFLLLPLLEYLFDLTTDITLLELSDLNHPLLKRMVVEAPGTYHHSLVVSTLAESACEAIGANALLARVGCYFHDIGKIARAEFFTENEKKHLASRHEALSPEASRQLIMGHVKDGLALGREHRLRSPILRFIPEHHGTSVIYYFYRKALDFSSPGIPVNADDYRYPGPKPQSRETAVALLADSTEAASRSLEDLSPEGLRRLVRKVINDKFIDGQFDECDLTLRDLHRIQESFVHNLMAIYHTRVRYPQAPDAADRPDLFERNQFSKYRSETRK